MPLRAIIDGEELIAPFINDAKWEAIKEASSLSKSEILLPCCGAKGHLRTTKLGTKYFMHSSKADCDWKPESWETLKAKTDIALACRKAGYNVATEVQDAAGWRADVLATKGSVKIVYEVQWATQYIDETEARQKEYEAAGIRGCWFFKKSPLPPYQARRDLPLFQLSIDDEGLTQVFLRENCFYPLDHFVESMLTRRLRFCPVVKSKKNQLVRLIFYEIECWNCGKMSHIYCANNPLTDCGFELDNDPVWNGNKYKFVPEIQAAVTEFSKSEEGKHLKIGTIKQRFSKTDGKSYLSFGCPDCDATFGDFHVMNNICQNPAYNEEKAAAILEKEMIVTSVTETFDHWCYPEHEEFCC